MADQVIIDRTNELHNVVKQAWDAAPQAVPFNGADTYGIVYKLKDKDGLPPNAENRPWCRVTLLFGGATRSSIGKRRTTQGGELITQIFVPNKRDNAGGICLRLAEHVKTAYKKHRGRCDLSRILIDGNGDSGGYASALVVAQFSYEEFIKGN